MAVWSEQIQPKPLGCLLVWFVVIISVRMMQGHGLDDPEHEPGWHPGPQPTKSVLVSQTTQPSRPVGYVSNFTMEFGVDKIYRELHVSWMKPNRVVNTWITKYVFKHNATDQGVVTVTLQPRWDGHTYYLILDVVPEHWYWLQVYAVDAEGRPGNVITKVIYIPCGVPRNKVEDEDHKTVIRAMVHAAPGATYLAVTIYKPFFQQDSNGPIVSHGLIGCAEQYCRFKGLQCQPASYFNNMTSWNDVIQTGMFGTYRITPSNWMEELVVGRRKRRATMESNYVIGIDQCDRSKQGFCNGPLMPGTKYILRATVCTTAGCLLSKKYGPFATLPAKVEQKGVIAGYLEEVTSSMGTTTVVLVTLVMVAIIVALVIVIAVLVIRRSTPRKSPSYVFTPKPPDVKSPSKLTGDIWHKKNLTLIIVEPLVRRVIRTPPPAVDEEDESEEDDDDISYGWEKHPKTNRLKFVERHGPV